MCPCAHVCLVASRALASGCIAMVRMDLLSSPSPKDIKVCLLFPSFLPVTHPLERNLCLQALCADPHCCPCMPSLLMEGLASLHVSHAQFILLDWVSQASIYSGPMPSGRVFYSINNNGQSGGLLSSSSLPFGTGARCLWDRSMTFLYKVQWPSLG